MALFLDRVWNKAPDAPLFPPKVWGIGWSYNFAYPFVPTRPLWKRVFAFVLGLVFLLLIIYALVVVTMLLYFLVTTPPAQSVTVTITEAGPIVT